jgi:hypothetical protein
MEITYGIRVWSLVLSVRYRRRVVMVVEMIRRAPTLCLVAVAFIAAVALISSVAVDAALAGVGGPWSHSGGLVRSQDLPGARSVAYYVGRRCRSATIKDVAADLRLDWHTVKTLDQQYMQAQLVDEPAGRCCPTTEPDEDVASRFNLIQCSRQNPED